MFKSSSQCGRELVLKPDDLSERKGFEMAGPLIVHMSMIFEGVGACRVMGTLRQGWLILLNYEALLAALLGR